MDDEIMMTDHGFALPGSYEAGPNDSGTEHSERKLQLAAEDLKTNLPKHVTIESVACKAEAETWAYRCRCTFQIVNDCNGDFHYAMRTQGKAIPIGAPYFPIATRRIQESMTTLIEDILTSSDFSDLVRGLTSLTFSSAWHDTPEADCTVTLMYGEPVDETKWKAQAMAACQQMRLRQLYGSAKKCLLAAMPDDESRSTLRDSVYIHQSSSWIVSLTPLDNTIKDANIEVQYEKPNTAFFHPNSFAMKDALHWILDRLSYIIGHGGSSSCSMLELYCGCGAHTVALGKSGMLKDITAIELDHRLIEACKRNVRLNGLEDIVTVVQSDAGAWAKRSCKSTSSNYYDILLVDPPRAGLDQDVCSMAKQGGFVHFLYISCGHRALLRDLERLSDCFDVIHCRQLDLFPRTDSIETLVHLRRRQNV
jgi:tRNA/tmRNA/rRNA uracil-C5-methylase (TrmA/RlmC/RlmD family)